MSADRAKDSQDKKPRRPRGPMLTLTPAVLRWAREYRQRSLEEVADWLKSPVDRIVELEQAGGPLSAAEFARLARHYKLPQSTLAAPSPPQVPSVPTDYRTLGERPKTLSLLTLSTIGQMQAWQQIASELAESENIVLNIPQAQLSDPPSQVAAGQRASLGLLSDQLQLSFHDPYKLFTRIREQVESLGISVYVVAFSREDNIRGVSDWANDVPPYIAINIKETEWSARTFTLLHEYAHLLVRRPGISDENRQDRIEVWCNRFAANALMPKSIVERFFRVGTQVAGNEVASAARSIGCSAQSLALRLEELGLAPSGFYKTFVAGQSKGTSKKGKKGNYVNTQVFSLARNYQRQVIGALNRGRIAPVEASRLLRLSPRHFGAVRKAINA